MAAPSAWAARSVAVLPFDQGAGSDAYAGLGRALAGMVVSDLSRVDTLQLVERAKLEALLSEIELSDKGYLDPKTAVQLGNGLGAEWVVVGSWSVVGKTFVMDGRAVDVASGKIVAAVDANGGIDDFVTVEKTLVETLLTELSVELSAGARRKIIASAPTEDFTALSTYAAGLQAQFEGDYDAARKHFEAAAAKDPSFEAPMQRLVEVRQRLEQNATNRQEAAKDARTRHLEAALARTPDEMALSGRSKTIEEVSQLAIRFSLLDQLDRHCQAKDEMNHYLERHQGKLPAFEHPDPYNHKHWAAFDVGLYAERPEIWNHGTVSASDDYRWVVDDAPSTTHGQSFLIYIVDGIDRAESLGTSLVNLTVACAGPSSAARLAALRDLRERMDRLGINDLVNGSNPGEDVPAWVEVELLQLQAKGRMEGMSAEVRARIDVLLELDEKNPGYRLGSDLTKVTRIVTAGALDRNALGKLTIDEAERLVQAAFDGDSGVVTVDAPQCAPFVRQAENTLKQLQKARKKDGIPRGLSVRRAGGLANGLLLVGCVEGTPATIDSLGAAAAWADTVPNRLRADRPLERCTENLDDLTKALPSLKKPYSEAQEPLNTALIVLRVFNEAVVPGCATIE